MKLKYEAQDWVASADLYIDLMGRDQVDVQVACSENVTVFGVRGDDEIPLFAGTSFRFAAELVGFTAVSVRANVEFGACVRVGVVQLEDVRDDEVVTVPEVQPGNLLAQIRAAVRQELRSQQRAAGPVTGYELDDDDEDLFEEDLLDGLSDEDVRQLAMGGVLPARSAGATQPVSPVGGSDTPKGETGATGAPMASEAPSAPAAAPAAAPAK